jgi:hypothetical protein
MVAQTLRFPPGIKRAEVEEFERVDSANKLLRQVWLYNPNGDKTCSIINRYNGKVFMFSEKTWYYKGKDCDSSVSFRFKDSLSNDSICSGKIFSYYVNGQIQRRIQIERNPEKLTIDTLCEKYIYISEKEKQLVEVTRTTSGSDSITTIKRQYVTGNLIKETDYINNKISSELTCGYSKKGNKITESIHVFPGNKLAWKSEFQYYPNDSVMNIKRTMYLEGGGYITSTWHYTEDGLEDEWTQQNFSSDGKPEYYWHSTETYIFEKEIMKKIIIKNRSNTTILTKELNYFFY